MKTKKQIRWTAAWTRGVTGLLLTLFVFPPAWASLPGSGGQRALFAARTLVLAQSGAEQETGSPGQIVRVLSVGSVLTEDGTIWQYLPDRGRWVEIDESFRLQKRETHILPLPVPVRSIREMQTFGFLLTETGDCWLYDLGKDSWQKLPVPQR